MAGVSRSRVRGIGVGLFVAATILSSLVRAERLRTALVVLIFTLTFLGYWLDGKRAKAVGYIVLVVGAATFLYLLGGYLIARHA